MIEPGATRRAMVKRTTVALAHDHHDAALAGLVLSEATVAATLFLIGRLYVTAEIDNPGFRERAPSSDR
jgi:hypothetical protein